MKWTRLIIISLSVSLAVLTLLAYAPLRRQAAADTTWKATWYRHPASLAEARDLASSIIVARVAAVRQAEDIVVAAPGEPTGEDRIPTQRIILEVERALKGDAAGQLTLFRSGSDTVSVEGDPAYSVGETYVLFLEPKADEAGSYLVIAPEGRYAVHGGSLAPVVDHGFAASLRGMSVEALALALDQAR